MQMQWPPVGIEPVGWDKRALVMSAVLAASYYSANVAMVAKDPKTVMGAMLTTMGLGFMFLFDQVREIVFCMDCVPLMFWLQLGCQMPFCGMPAVSCC